MVVKQIFQKEQTIDDLKLQFINGDIISPSPLKANSTDTFNGKSDLNLPV